MSFEIIEIGEYRLEQWREDDDDRYYILHRVTKKGSPDSILLDCGNNWLSKEEFNKFIQMDFPKREAVPTRGSIGSKELAILWQRHLDNQVDEIMLNGGDY